MSDALAARRSTAIFRVVTDGAGYVFTRRLFGPGVEPSESGPERSGPFATERAAFELAQRAASRFSAQSPDFVVGVVGIEPEAKASRQPLSGAEKAEARKAKARARSRAKYARKTATPEGRERMREKARERYARRVATPEGRMRERRKWRKPGGVASPIRCEAELAGVVPTCEVCGAPTHYTQGRAVRFCSRKPGEKRSACQMRYTSRVAEQRFKADPEKRKARNKKNRETRRNNPRRHAMYLAQKRIYKERYKDRERIYKQRRRERDRLNRPEAQPTGSVLMTASPRSIGRDVLLSIYAAVPERLPHDFRMDIICEAALLIMEGTEFSQAITQANKNVRKNAAQLRYTKPIEDCFWLADESAWSPEVVL